MVGSSFNIYESADISTEEEKQLIYNYILSKGADMLHKGTLNVKCKTTDTQKCLVQNKRRARAHSHIFQAFSIMQNKSANLKLMLTVC